eukprot:2933756-Pyramimonas_sp.AAC.1
MRFRTGAFRTKSTVDTAPVSQSASQSASQSLSHSSRLPANVQSNLFFWVGGWCCDSFSRRHLSEASRDSQADCARGGDIFLLREPIAQQGVEYSSDESQSHNSRKEIPLTRANRTRKGEIFLEIRQASPSLDSAPSLHTAVA